MFQQLDIKASTRNGVEQLCAGEHIIGSKSSLIMVRLRFENLVAAKLKVGAAAYLFGFSKV